MGCTYIDVAPAYGGGEAERLLGPALAPHRDKVFLSCKTGLFRESTEAAIAQLENSFEVLQTDHLSSPQRRCLHPVDSRPSETCVAHRCCRPTTSTSSSSTP